MQLSEKLLAKASGRAEKSWVFRIREKSVNQISVFILRGWSARSSDTEYRNTVYLGGGDKIESMDSDFSFQFFSAWGYNNNWERHFKNGIDGRWQFC